MNKFLRGLGVLGFGLVASVVTLNTAYAQTISPNFNVYTDVSGIGDESDFLRIGDQNGGNTIEACADGQTVDLWMYIHNGSAETGNGENYEGPAVATNTTLKLNMEQNAFKNNHNLSATISADNATSVTDGVTITCAGQEVSLEYVGVKDFFTTNPSDDYTLDGDPINGAKLGFDGKVPGCWEYRAAVTMTVKVHIKEEEPKEFTLKCEVLPLVPVPNKTNAYSISVKGSATPSEAATVSGGTITISGPNSYSAQFDGVSIADYTFPQVDGRYTVKGFVDFTVSDEYKTDDTKETSVTCERYIDIKTPTEEPPETPEQPIVPELPNTGAGTNIALFAAVVIASSFAYRKYLASRS